MSTPPFPLPDLPRAPDSDLSRMACRVLEWRDMEALTRLPDMLRDMGRDEDADYIREMLGATMYRVFAESRPGGVNAHSAPSYRRMWAEYADDIARLVWFDIFDWAGTLAVMGRAMSGPIGGAHGSFTTGGVTVTTGPWSIDDVTRAGFSDAVTVATSNPNLSVTVSAIAHADVPRLHAEESHPDYEYRDAAECPDGAGWEHNPHAIPFNASDTCWMRRRTPPGAAQ